MIPKRRDDVRLWQAADETVMYDPLSDTGHVLNPTALHIWALCDGQHTANDIELSLLGSFPEQGDQIKHDVIDAITRFGELGLLDSPAS